MKNNRVAKKKKSLQKGGKEEKFQQN